MGPESLTRDGAWAAAVRVLRLMTGPLEIPRRRLYFLKDMFTELRGISEPQGSCKDPQDYSEYYFIGTSLRFQRLRFRTATAEGVGSVPGGGIRSLMPHSVVRTERRLHGLILVQGNSVNLEGLHLHQPSPRG